MSTGGAGVNRRGRDGKFPAGYRPPGGVQGNPAASDAPADGSLTPPVPADQAASEQLHVVENQKAAVEALQRRLTVQEQTIESLALANEKFVGGVDALRKVDSHKKERRVAKSRRQSGDKIKTDKKKGKMTKGKSACKDEQTNAVSSSSSHDSASGSNPTSSDDDNSNATSTSSSDDGHGPPDPMSPPSGSSPSDSSSESDATTRKPSTVPTKRKDRVEKADRIKVIRPANSRFTTLLDYRSYFLIRRQLTYTPKEAQRSHRLKKLLDGASHGQQPFTGALPLDIFTFLTTFRRACDAAGLTDGQALPLIVFRLSGNAKMVLSGALNSTIGRKRYAIRMYGDAINWLLSKYATHATMANAYQDIIAMKQQDSEAPTAFGHRVETQCALLNGLFNVQDVKDVCITGLSDLVQAHVRILNDQFPDRTLSETVATAQLYWDGNTKLRSQLKMTRPTAIKVAYATQDKRTTMDRPFTPVRTPKPPRDAAPQANRASSVTIVTSRDTLLRNARNRIAPASVANRQSALTRLPMASATRMTRPRNRP